MKIQLALYILLLFGAFGHAQECEDFQLLGTLQGGEDYGRNVSLSNDGSNLIVGGLGEARVYEYTGETWSQKGAAISGDGGFGLMVDINSDGSVITVCGQGISKVYVWNICEWTQIGQTLDDCDVARINDSGTRIAVSNTGWSNSTGRARVYELNEAAWVQLGDDITGGSEGEAFGKWIDINDSGDRLVITDQGSSEPELVRIYDYVNGSWIQQENSYADAGDEAMISGDGNTIVYDSNNGSEIQTIKWNGVEWSTYEAISFGLGDHEFSINSDGSRLVVGFDAPSAGVNYTYVYHFDAGEWQMILELEPTTISGTGSGSGAPLAISDDGSVLARGFHCCGFVDVWGVNCGLPSEGCTDPAACNYDASATEDDNSCVYGPFPYDCDLNCLNDVNGNGICDEFESGPSFNPDANGDGVIDVTDLLSIIPLFGMPFEADPCIGSE